MNPILKILSFPALTGSLLVANVAHGAPPPDSGFCAITPGIQFEHGDEMWGAESVQHYIRQLLGKEHIRDRSVAAYAVSYLKMTERRDEERCGGSLSAEDPRSEAIGDLLADLMSRWMILETDACSQDAGGGASGGIGICGATRYIVANDLDTMGAALTTTSAYLSSHMAKALAAVMLSDQVWRAHFPAAYHCPTSGNCPAQIRKLRLDAIQTYKKLYDKNNAFLAKNISTVTQTLNDACYLKTGALTIGARLIDQLPFNTELFKLLRDKTFFTAIELAQTIRPEDHPMLVYASGSGWIPQFQEYRNFRTPPTTLLRLEATAKHLFANGAIAIALRPLGSVTPGELAAIQPSRNGACLYPGD